MSSDSFVDGNDLQNDILEDVEPNSSELDACIPVKSGWARFGGFELVGNGAITNAHCGQFRNFRGCIRVDLHNVVDVHGRDFRGKVVFERVFSSCNKPSCPICCRRGWAVREARKIERRLTEAKKFWGEIEHIVVSPPPKDYGLEFQALRSKAVRLAEECGVVGGVALFHPARYDDARNWYYSPHFHMIGFIRSGYGHCRGCSRKFAECIRCSGFEGVVRRQNEKEGYIIKVLGKRKTVFGTAWYQLHHSGIRVGARRQNVATWFGVCSYRKLKVPKEKKEKHLCPICGEEFSRIMCLVDKMDVPAGRGVLFDNMLGSDGLPRWSEVYGGWDR